MDADRLAPVTIRLNGRESIVEFDGQKVDYRCLLLELHPKTIPHLVLEMYPEQGEQTICGYLLPDDQAAEFIAWRRARHAQAVDGSRGHQDIQPRDER